MGQRMTCLARGRKKMRLGAPPAACGSSGRSAVGAWRLTAPFARWHLLVAPPRSRGGIGGPPTRGRGRSLRPMGDSGRSTIFKSVTQSLMWQRPLLATYGLRLKDAHQGYISGRGARVTASPKQIMETIDEEPRAREHHHQPPRQIHLSAREI